MRAPMAIPTIAPVLGPLRAWEVPATCLQRTNQVRRAKQGICIRWNLTGCCWPAPLG